MSIPPNWCVQKAMVNANYFSGILPTKAWWAIFTFYICLLSSLHCRRSIPAGQRYLAMKYISSSPGLGDYKLASLSDTSPAPFWHAPPTSLYRHVHPYGWRNLPSTHLCTLNLNLKVSHSIIIQKTIYCMGCCNLNEYLLIFTILLKFLVIFNINWPEYFKLW